MKLDQLRILLLTAMVLVISSSCAGIYFDRSFIDKMEHEESDFFVAGEDFPVVAGDQSTRSKASKMVNNRVPRYRRERESLDHGQALLKELKEKESYLSEIEYRRYNNLFDKSKVGNSERIYYLSLSYAERDNYHRLLAGQIKNRATLSSNQASLFQRSPASVTMGRRDISVGMNKDEVVLLVGPPAKIETAYNRPSGRSRVNGERWTYYDRGNTVRHIFFENNQVHGWQLE
ncbi:MAG: hypothetical protein HN353_06165 [Bdellovibrionales bacterium]|jgi:hypothetical protein|nr:hypothetical protein [Bdellovibrionales bacterium]MBT3526217.1 hypothetical protein [Bdellovibrionales bacterium]MBT7668183.1 hypothetical protein [Bdellovibrionales bacterium]MBT7765512.1 hypothetical protein [Bdellovibrionales bacterium]